MLKLIQVGIGSFGWSWAKIVKASEYWEAVAYVDLDEERLKNAATEYNMPKSRCYTDLDEALSKVEADAVLVVVPPEAHAEVGIKALEAELHVLVEKPLADTIENAKRFVAEAEKRNLKLMVSQNYRFRKGARTVRSVLEAGKAGEPSYAVVNFHKAPHFGGFREKMPFPLLVDMSIHHFDLMRYIFNADPRSLYAETWKPKWSWFEGDPCAVVVVNMESGLRVTYIGSWVSLGRETTWDGEWKIECSDGGIRWNETVKVSSKGSKGIAEEKMIPMPLEGRAYSLYEFAEAITQDREPETSGEDNLKSLAMVFAALDSAKTGRRIFIEDYFCRKSAEMSSHQPAASSSLDLPQEGGHLSV